MKPEEIASGFLNNEAQDQMGQDNKSKQKQSWFASR
jgi:hypothetical protein